MGSKWTISQFGGSGGDSTSGSIRRCCVCDIAYVDPQSKGEIEVDCFPESTVRPRKSQKGIAIRYAALKASIEQITALAADESITDVLDFATADGHFAIAAIRAIPGARVEAVGWGDEAPTAIRLRGKAIQYAPVTEWRRQVRSYDLILLHDCLEHSCQPAQLLKFLGGLLSDHGQLYIEVRDSTAELRRLPRHTAGRSHIPEQAYYYSRRSLMETIHHAGLRICEIGSPMAVGSWAARRSIQQRNPISAAAVALLKSFHLHVGGRAGRLAALCRRQSLPLPNINVEITQ